MEEKTVVQKGHTNELSSVDELGGKD
jgi:hypothetical protein